MRPVFTFIFLAVILTACSGAAPPSETIKPIKQEQDLVITVGGFLKDGPESEKLEGVCGTDHTRNVLNCDIYNGLPNWNVTEVTLEVAWLPYQDENKRFFRNRVSIPPMTTSRVSIKLGMLLPPDDVIKPRAALPPTTFTHWSWIITGAKGEHV
jgi:hypothetical protein